MAKVVTDSIYYQTIAELLRAEAYSEELTQKRYKPSEMAGGVTRVADENRESGMKMGETIGENRVLNAIKRCFEDRNYAPPDAVVDAYALTNGAMLKEYYRGRRVGKQEEYDRFWDSYQQNGSRANYRFAFAGPCWATKEILIPKYPIKIVDISAISRRCMYMFAYFNSGGAEPFDMTELCAKIDFSEATSIQNLFNNAFAENITVDASKAIDCSGAFGLGDGGKLNNITLTVSDACTTFTGTFNAKTITNLTITEGSQIAATIDLKSCPLTKASIDSVYNALSGTATGKTVSFNKAAVNAAYTTDDWNALVAQKSNWTFTLV